MAHMYRNLQTALRIRHEGVELQPFLRTCKHHVGFSLKSLKGGYIGDYYRNYEGGN